MDDVSLWVVLGIVLLLALVEIGLELWQRAQFRQDHPWIDDKAWEDSKHG